jgi:hypothetical protein
VIPASDNEKPQHPPNKKKGHDRCEDMANPLPRRARLAETKHPPMVAPRRTPGLPDRIRVETGTQ